MTGYYGFPNFAKFSITDNGFNNNSSLIKGINPCGIRGEYIVGDKIGVGFDFIYNSAHQKYTDSLTSDVYNTSTQLTDTITIITAEEYSMQRIRLMARINFHFDTGNPALDAYFGLGVGTNNRFWKHYTNGAKQPVASGESSSTLIPVSARICTGLRYYFSPNVGVNMELGLGGPMISAGISCKIK